MELPHRYVYSSEALRKLGRGDKIVPRSVRKNLFLLQIWCLQSKRVSRLYPPSHDHDRTQHNVLRLGTCNVQNMDNKDDSVSNVMISHNLDICGVVETQYQSGWKIAHQMSVPKDFHVIDEPRQTADHHPSNAECGGIAFLYRTDLQAKQVELSTVFTTFEVLISSCSVSHSQIIIAIIYRTGLMPPSLTFIQEFAIILENLDTCDSQLVIMGNLNVDIEDPICPWAAQLRQLVTNFRLQQHVSMSTDTGCLDLVITRDDCQPVTVTLGLELHQFPVSGCWFAPFHSNTPIHLPKTWQAMGGDRFTGMPFSNTLSTAIFSSCL